MRTRPLTLVAAAAAALVLAGCGSAASGGTGAGGAGSAVTSTGVEAASGTYVTLADYEQRTAEFADTTVVYFFHAPWCPSCRATEKAIGESGVPEGLTLVKVDYDSETDLKQEYGVTTQHTFVEVDASGAEMAKWTGSTDGAAILAETL